MACSVMGAVLLPWGVGSAGAQSRPTVVPGTASAVSKGFVVGVALNGSLDGAVLGLTRGLASADARDQTATGKGQVLDLGLLASFNRLPTPECPNVVPLFNPATLPTISMAESSDPGAATSRPTTVNFPGTPTAGPEAGVQDATAGPRAIASAVTSSTFSDGFFMTASGLHSEATASVDESGRRTANSVVSADRIEIAGWITLNTPRFVATSTNGGPSTASFTFDSVTFLGQTRSGAEGRQMLEDARVFVEGLFSWLGLKIDLPVPRSTVTPNPSRDTTALQSAGLSPLRVRVTNIPIARDLLGGLIAQIGPEIMRRIREELASDPCSDQSISNTAQLVLNTLAGDGELGVSIGEVSASTSDRWVAPPPQPPVTSPEAAPTPPVTDAPRVSPQVESRSPRRTTASPDIAASPGPPYVPDSVPEPTEPPPVTVAREPAPVETPSLLPVRPTSNEVPASGGPLAWAAAALLAGVVCIAFGDRAVLARRRTA